MKSEVSTLRKDLLTTQSLHLLHSRYTYYTVATLTTQSLHLLHSRYTYYTVATLTTQSLTYYVHFSY
jgi:hypothetical protein